MIPKSGYRFRIRSCPNKKIGDESDSTKLKQTLARLVRKLQLLRVNCGACYLQATLQNHFPRITGTSSRIVPCLKT
jgi:hypothetical protein